MTFDERVKRLEECEEDENHIQRKKIAYAMHFEDKRLRAEYSRESINMDIVLNAFY